jgi:hypothetical protein
MMFGPIVLSVLLPLARGLVFTGAFSLVLLASPAKRRVFRPATRKPPSSARFPQRRAQRLKTKQSALPHQSTAAQTKNIQNYSEGGHHDPSQANIRIQRIWLSI